MRHRRATLRLGRNRAERRALFSNLAKAVLTNQMIRTTAVKAKEASRVVDRLITLGKKNTLAAKRQVHELLQDHELVSKLFKDIAPRFAKRQGGYTRVMRLGSRKGDAAPMALLELTEKEIKVKAVKKKDKKAKETVKEKPSKPEAEHKETPKETPKETHVEHPKHPEAKGPHGPGKGNFLKNLGRFFRNKGGA